MPVSKEQEAAHAQCVRSSLPSMHSVRGPVIQVRVGSESLDEGAGSAKPCCPEAVMRIRVAGDRLMTSCSCPVAYSLRAAYACMQPLTTLHGQHGRRLSEHCSYVAPHDLLVCKWACSIKLYQCHMNAFPLSSLQFG